MRYEARLLLNPLTPFRSDRSGPTELVSCVCAENGNRGHMAEAFARMRGGGSRRNAWRHEIRRGHPFG